MLSKLCVRATHKNQCEDSVFVKETESFVFGCVADGCSTGINEAWANSFTINMLGVGTDTNFRAACIEMGLDPDKCLSTVGTTAGEIRQKMGVVSQSVSSSTGSTTVSF